MSLNGRTDAKPRPPFPPWVLTPDQALNGGFMTVKPIPGTTKVAIVTVLEGDDLDRYFAFLRSSNGPDDDARIAPVDVLQTRVWNLNVAKAWHDEPAATFVERCMLAVSELSEAVEEYRDHRGSNETYVKTRSGGK